MIMPYTNPPGCKQGFTLSRRDVLTTCLCVAAATMLTPMQASAADERSPQFQEAYAKLTGGAQPTERGVTLELPEIAENGNMVPFSVSVQSPMTDADYVKQVTILSTGNPQPVIATFHLSPDSGRAQVSGRLRLARTQDLIAVAELNSGALVSGRTNVKVTVGGCGG
jgi:sulfur-oxidizing protein SoxY